MEASRARAFATSALGLCGLVIVEELVLDDSAGIEALTLASFVGLGLAARYARTATVEGARYTRAVARLLAVASLLAATAMLTYRFGVLSPAPMLTTLAIAFFGLGEDKVVAYGFTALAGVAYVTVAALIVAEAISLTPGSSARSPWARGRGRRSSRSSRSSRPQRSGTHGSAGARH